jgi:hypothetical protein
MYRNCIYCSAEFGSNEAIEEFPIGRQLAFDAWRGRLWAVCPRCARWNLAPIEERWEAVEEAEKLFRDARLRVQSENVGLAKLPDGTRLVRVGKAMPGEMAAWRYGRQLLHRRRRHLLLSGAGVAAAATVWGGLHVLGVSFIGIWLGYNGLKSRVSQRVVHRVAKADDPAGLGVSIRRWHLPGLRLLAGVGPDDIQLEIRDAHRQAPRSRRGGVDPTSKDIVVISGMGARAALARAMVRVNKQGATRAGLMDAERILTEAGSAERLLREAALGGAGLGNKAGTSPEVLEGPGALAFEMALHEESERRALEGELSALETAWSEAEEIAAIADSLPGEEQLDRLLAGLLRLR